METTIKKLEQEVANNAAKEADMKKQIKKLQEVIQGTPSNYTWFLIKAPNGLVLGTAGTESGERVILMNNSGADNQLWQWSADDQLVSNSTGMAMDISGKSDADGAPVITWSKHDGDNQKWEIRGDYIHSKMNDKVMQASGTE